MDILRESLTKLLAAYISPEDNLSTSITAAKQAYSIIVKVIKKRRKFFIIS